MSAAEFKGSSRIMSKFMPDGFTLESRFDRTLRAGAKVLCALTLCLIFFGGQVKSHDAGLSVPDWPLTYGQNPITFPVSKWQGGIFHEHFHRLFAGAVASLTVMLAGALIWAARRGRVARGLALLGVGAVVAVLLQALLGGLTVWYKLPVLVSSSHALLAQTFLLIVVLIAYGLSTERRRRTAAVASGRAEASTPLKRAALVLIALIYVQLFLGALMRHTESGLAIPDFPTTAGRILPAFNEDTLRWVNDWRFEVGMLSTGEILEDVTIGQMLIHFAHRCGAILVTCAVGWVLWLARRHRETRPELWRTALLLGLLVLAQFTLGVFTVWMMKQPIVTSFHVTTGAALLAATTLLALRAWPLRPVEAVSTAAAAGTRARATAS